MDPFWGAKVKCGFTLAIFKFQIHMIFNNFLNYAFILLVDCIMKSCHSIYVLKIDWSPFGKQQINHVLSTSYWGYMESCSLQLSNSINICIIFNDNLGNIIMTFIYSNM